MVHLGDITIPPKPSGEGSS
jgi:hypothetical protein